MNRDKSPPAHPASGVTASPGANHRSDPSPAAGDPNPKTPVHTRPLDESQRGAWLEGPDIITAFRELDGDVEYELPRKGTFTMGASRNCDLVVPGLGLSATHCLLERKGTRLRLYDQHSTNGTYVAGRRIEVVDLNPGDTFTPAPVTFLAMNDVMREQRPIMAELLGTNFTPSPDRVIVDAAKSFNHLLITGETGCDQPRLVRAIHAVSLRRARALVELSELPHERAKQRDILKHAARSTLVINLDHVTAPLDPTFCSMAFSRDYHVRVIVLAPTTDVARKLIPIEHIEQLQHIWLRPLAMRPGDVPGIFDKLLAARQAPFQLADLTPANQRALCANEWRDNFAGLRTAADRLTAISRMPTWCDLDWRDRSAALGLAKSTLHDWFTGLGLSFPLWIDLRGERSTPVMH